MTPNCEHIPFGNNISCMHSYFSGSSLYLYQLRRYERRYKIAKMGSFGVIRGYWLRYRYSLPLSQSALQTDRTSHWKQRHSIESTQVPISALTSVVIVIFLLHLSYRYSLGLRPEGLLICVQ